MSEEGDFWRQVKQVKEDKKGDNFQKSKNILDKEGIKYRHITQNCQLIIGDWSFWPTTGKFYNPKTGQKGRGVFNLLKQIK